MGRGQLMKLKEKSQSIKSIKHITKAMEMVARAKFQKVEKETLAFRPYSNGIKDILEELTKRNISTKHPLLTGKDGKIGLLVVSSDMGLCGSYNTNLIKTIKNIENPDNLVLYVIGKIGYDRLKNHYNIKRSYIKAYDRPNFEDAQKIATDIVQDFKDGVFGKFSGVFTFFRSVISYEARYVDVIPVKIDNENKYKTEYEYYPSSDELLDLLFEDYISTQIFNMLLEAKASELGARQTAMQNATDNADELIYELTLSANKARQAYITQELNEIVSGVEALNKG